MMIFSCRNTINPDKILGSRSKFQTIGHIASIPKPKQVVYYVSPAADAYQRHPVRLEVGSDDFQL
ncbi:hypothetical protein Ciccas_007626 [Cichlidogyrus casuarinus]|uniref:Uncharacterized protein n=1 Tax=Cichlidogyrus casuarinus TaxID=1844966 RepID=A0ABD2Q2B6_9PLAT